MQKDAHREAVVRNVGEVLHRGVQLLRITLSNLELTDTVVFSIFSMSSSCTSSCFAAISMQATLTSCRLLLGTACAAS